MKHLQAVVVVIACGLALVSASALARDVRFPAENACPDVAQQCFRANMFNPADYGSPVITPTVTQGQSALLRDWARDDATEVALKAVQADTLIVGGADDVVLPRQNSDALGGLIAGARLEVVALAGHAMMYQYPEALAALINGFIEQTDRRHSPMPVAGTPSMPSMKMRATP